MVMDMTVEDQIRQRAYEIWDREGRPDGKQEEHWTRACQEIAAETGVKTDCSHRPVAFAEPDVDATGDDKPAHQVRSAGPDAMRDTLRRPWDKTDQSSDESFPASDPPPY
jgi:hypothetical protein